MESINNPLISVITPSYNSERFIAEAIESVLNQTYQNWEMIIVDDKSKDRTPEIVEKYAEMDPRIKLIRQQENRGSGVARNTAIQNAKGRFLAFLDSDDLWLPEKLEKQLQFMLEKDIAFSFAKYERITEDGSPTGRVTDVPEQVDYEGLLKRCVIGCLTVMLDKEKIGEVKMNEIRTRQDYVLWLTITKQGHIAYGIPEVLAKYRLVENSISSNKIRVAKQNWKVYREIEKLSLPKSLWYFFNYGYISIKQKLTKEI